LRRKGRKMVSESGLWIKLDNYRIVLQHTYGTGVGIIR
jgi:hypothetical protein